MPNGQFVIYGGHMSRSRCQRVWASVLVGALAGCSSSTEPGLELRVVSVATGLSTSVQLSAGDGGAVRLDDLNWTSVEVELLRCRTALGWLGDTLIRSARAHGTSSPTLLAVPMVETAQALDDVVLGTLRPPPARYCGVRYQLGPADADAFGLGDRPEMIRRSIYARGESALEGRAGERFSLASSATFEVMADLELDLSGEVVPREVRIERDESGWFRGVDVRDPDPARQADQLVENFRTSVTIGSR